MNEMTTAILIAAMGSTGLWATVLGIFQAVWKRRDEARDRVRNENAQKIASMESEVQGVKAENVSQTEALVALKEAVREILHVMLYSRCADVLTAYNDKAITHITTEKLQEITELYDVYVKMGGNGTGKILYEKVKTIPLKQS